ncbi:MAG: chloride channel protein [Microthrixaceae bacterium]|nr:chloride channel protein [Microthrixaceae bacterium]MCO5313361.1 chloride channel protein [Microthrixaceae bacterium]HPB45153.1 chloride channel protein [Microthrixaceae bacterium]
MLSTVRFSHPAREVILGVFTRRRLAGLVVAAGLVGGLIGAAYLFVLELVSERLLPEHWSAAGHLGVMIVVGVVVTGLIRLLGPPSDVELLVDNIHVSGGAEGVRSLRSLIPVSLICVGAGGPLGPEAPLVTATGTMASWMGGRAGLDREPLRVLSITGMAAGFTVLFGAPLGAAVFALEILHRRGLEYYEALLPASVGSLSGYAVSIVLSGAGLEPIWSFPSPERLVSGDLAIAVAAGVVGALIGYLFTYLTVAMRRLAAWVAPGARPVVGAVVLSGLAALSPYALTNGEVQMQHLSATTVTVGALLVGAAAKLVASAVAMATGWRGGFIIPLFFVGFCLGRALDGHLPFGNSWVLVAALMVAANVAVTKTPIGSTLVVTEMAGMVLLPTVLIAAIVALLLSSPVSLIESQQRRFDPSKPGEGDT